MIRPIETVVRIGGDGVPAVRAERGPDDPGVLEGGHDLLEELGRQPVAPGQRGQRDRPIVGVPNEINEGTQAVLRATGEAHAAILAAIA